MSRKYSFLECMLFLPTGLNKTRLSNRLKGKTILITGASFGIGESLSLMLAETGARLILVGRTTDKLEQVKQQVEEKGGKAEIYTADLRDDKQLSGLISFLNELENGIDILVNNAGKSIRRSFLDSLERYHDFTRTMAVNYNAPVQLILSLTPSLIKNKGQIINVSALNALLTPAPNWSAYQASKAAFDHWFRSVSPELNAENVATTSIYLPLVKTRMIEPTVHYQNKPAMKPEHVARIICKYMITRRRTYKQWWGAMAEFFSFLLSPLIVLFFIKTSKKDKRV
jgi:short-subunit dehydrogenase